MVERPGRIDRDEVQMKRRKRKRERELVHTALADYHRELFACILVFDQETVFCASCDSLCLASKEL